MRALPIYHPFCLRNAPQEVSEDPGGDGRAACLHAQFRSDWKCPVGTSTKRGLSEHGGMSPGRRRTGGHSYA